MIPRVVGRASDNPPETAATTINMTLPLVGLMANDLFIASIIHRSTGTAFTWPAGWTAVFTPVETGGVIRAECRYRVADGSETSPITLTVPGTGQGKTRVWRIEHGTYTGTPEAATASGNSVDANPPALTPSWGSCLSLWLTWIGWDGWPTITRYPNFYDLETFDTTFVGSSAWTRLGCSERNDRTTTANPPNYVSTTDDWIAATIAIQGSNAVRGAAIKYPKEV